LSGQFLQRSLFAAVDDAILSAIVPSHQHRNVTNQPKQGQIINCGLTILIVSVFPAPLTNYHTAQIMRCWQKGRYFYTTHSANLHVSTKPMNSFSVRLPLQPQRHFHKTDVSLHN